MKKTLILFCILSFVLLAGCTEKNDDNEANNDNEENVEINESNSFDYTDNDLVANGSTEYVILTPDKITSNEKTAISELSTFFFEATGIKLNTVSEQIDNIYFDKLNKVISEADYFRYTNKIIIRVINLKNLICVFNSVTKIKLRSIHSMKIIFYI